jgi:predicted nucleic acid-binding protein
MPFFDTNTLQAPLLLLDSAIIAAARALGCRELYSEDMSHGREVEGVTIVNPFR